MEDLKRFDIDTDPIATFEKWFERAIDSEENPHAMALATSTKEGKPSVRTVLYKGLSNNCLTFVTNYNSDKAKDIEENPNVALSFFWNNLGRQVTIKGSISKMNEADSRSYFQSRPKESQIASAVSNQSEKIESREDLVKKFDELKDSVGDGEVPYPQNWGGYLIDIREIEFFLYGEFRLNDRLLFTKSNDEWSIKRLQP